MNKEIKEILDRLDYNEWEVDLYKVPITWCELYDIRDYITNLQQKYDEADYDRHKLFEENERLKEWKEDLLKENIELENIRKEAIEYIKDNCSYEEDTKYCYDDLCSSDVNNLLNILQNGSDSQ